MGLKKGSTSKVWMTKLNKGEGVRREGFPSVDGTTMFPTDLFGVGIRLVGWTDPDSPGTDDLSKR